MAKLLTEEQIARACVLRDQRMSWENISIEVHRNKGTVRETLVALGYDRTLRPGALDDPERMQEAYELYQLGHSLSRVEAACGISCKTAQRWIIACGGEMRTHGGPRMSAEVAEQVGPGTTGWCKTVTCSIGAQNKGDFADGGSWYCARYCDWIPGKCWEAAAAVDLAQKARVEAKRDRVAKADEDRLSARRLGMAIGDGRLTREMRGERDE